MIIPVQPPPLDPPLDKKNREAGFYTEFFDWGGGVTPRVCVFVYPPMGVFGNGGGGSCTNGGGVNTPGGGGK